MRLATLRGLSVPIVMVLSLPLLLLGDLVVLFSWLAIIPVQAVITRRLRRLTADLELPLPT